jgi:hypothetical protein
MADSARTADLSIRGQAAGATVGLAPMYTVVVARSGYIRDISGA